jgi:hypothetical protein
LRARKSPRRPHFLIDLLDAFFAPAEAFAAGGHPPLAAGPPPPPRRDTRAVQYRSTRRRIGRWPPRLCSGCCCCSARRWQARVRSRPRRPSRCRQGRSWSCRQTAWAQAATAPRRAKSAAATERQMSIVAARPRTTLSLTGRRVAAAPSPTAPGRWRRRRPAASTAVRSRTPCSTNGRVILATTAGVAATSKPPPPSAPALPRIISLRPKPYRTAPH